MDGTSVVQLISNVGFPIAICLMLLWYVYNLIQEHREETNKFVEALNNNTKVLERLCDKMDINKEVN